MRRALEHRDDLVAQRALVLLLRVLVVDALQERSVELYISTRVWVYIPTSVRVYISTSVRMYISTRAREEGMGRGVKGERGLAGGAYNGSGRVEWLWKRGMVGGIWSG